MKFEKFPTDSKIPEHRCKVKFGIDPTSDKLHLGHLIPLRLVKHLRDLGHEIHIVLGTFTGQIGDPSGRNSTRPVLTSEETKRNSESIILQLNRILGEDFILHFNHDWFEKIPTSELIKLLSKFTINELLSRDSFQQRIEKNQSIGVHEIMVPILQGIDSVEVESEIEIGGTDQLFNFSLTRKIQQVFNQEPEICLLLPIINGTDGRKMSKSFGNCIFINDSPEDVFGKVMSISDEIMREWWGFFMEDEIEDPFTSKKKLSFTITKEIWNEELSIKAREHFERTIQNKQNPKNIPEIEIDNIINIIKKVRKTSKSESLRLLKFKSVKVNGETIDENFKLKTGDVLKIGKRDFVKII